MQEGVPLVGQEQMQDQIGGVWANITYDDVQRISESRDKVAGILQQRYGYTRLQAEQKIADFLNRMGAEFGRGKLIDRP